MAVKFLNSLDLNKNELTNARVQNLGSAPSSPVTGQIYYSTGDNTLYYWNGTAWEAAKSGAPTGAAGGDLAGSTYPNPTIANDAVTYAKMQNVSATDRFLGRDTAGAGDVEEISPAAARTILNVADGATANSSDATLLARANHTGTQLASTVSNFDTQVRTSTLNQMATPTADLGVGGFKLTGVGTPTADTDAATKAYVDAARSGLDVKASVRAATTAAGTLATSFENGDTIDGVALVTGDRILVKDQAAGAENGIYVVAASGAPTRATDADVSAEVTSGLFTFVSEGTVNADTGWVLATNDPITLGSTALVFAQFSGTGTIIGGAGLVKTGATLDAVGTANRITVAADSIDISTSYVGQATITTLGTITTGVWTGTDVAVADGGTGASTAAAARTNLGVPGKFAVDVGDGSATSITVTHNLATKDVHVTIYDLTTPFAEVSTDVEHTTTNTCTLKFAVAPTASQYRAVVVG